MMNNAEAEEILKRMMSKTDDPEEKEALMLGVSSVRKGITSVPVKNGVYRFCRECGGTVGDSAIYCKKCGKRVRE